MASDTPQHANGRMNASIVAAIFGLGTALYTTMTTFSVAPKERTPNTVAAFEQRVKAAAPGLEAARRIRFLEPNEGKDGRPDEYIPFLMLQYAVAPAVMIYGRPAEAAVWWSGANPVPLPPGLSEQWSVRSGDDPEFLILEPKKPAP